MLKRLFQPFPLLVITTAVMVLSFFGRYIFHANDHLLSAQGDGFKNYFTPAWYVKNDNGLHFTGMNYPYGEHVVFTDNQPVLSGIINFIDDHLFPVGEYTIGILNLLIFISLFVSVLLVYKILVHYQLPPWFAYFAALIIGLSAPQLQRISGHFALAYAVYFPAIWWFFIRTRKRQFNILSAATLIAVVIFFNFIHVYYLFIALLFFSAYFIVLLFRKKKIKREIFGVLVIIIVPLLFAMLFMKFTDHISDRTSSPYGFFDYKATFQSVFIKPDGKLALWMNEKFGTPLADDEGFAYVGVVGTVVLFLSIFLFVRRWITKKRFAGAFLILPGNLGSLLTASTLVLFFSMALPFSLGLDFLLDDIPFLKQFRSPGRLAWVFYYVFTVYGAMLIYILYKIILKINRVPALLFLFTALIIQGREMVVYMDNKSGQVSGTQNENPFASGNLFYADLIKHAGVDVNQYQAILFLPSFFQGSEKLYIDRTDGDYTKALEISYQSGLPLVNQMLSRTSISQTLKLASLTGHPALQKELPPGMNAKPILIISTGKNLAKGEHDLISKSKKIGSASYFHFYELEPSVITAKPLIFTDYFKSNRDSLHAFANNSYLSEDSVSIFYRNSFEDHNSPDPFMGNGSFYFESTERTYIDEIPVNVTGPVWIEVSYWVKCYSTTAGFPHIKVDFVDASGNLLHEHTVSAKSSTDIIGTWVRGAGNYEVVPGVKKIRLFCAESDAVNLDELVVRHTAYDIFYDVASDTSFMYNNYPVGAIR